MAEQTTSVWRGAAGVAFLLGVLTAAWFGAVRPAHAASPYQFLHHSYDYRFIGPAEVLDGHTLTIHGQPIRLGGVRAPGLDVRCTKSDGSVWACGREAMGRLARLVRNRSIACYGDERGADGAVQATCFLGAIARESLNERLVREGWVKPVGEEGRALRDLADVPRRGRVNVWSGAYVATDQAPPSSIRLNPGLVRGGGL